jgi:hypothetical protein
VNWGNDLDAYLLELRARPRNGEGRWQDTVRGLWLSEALHVPVPSAAAIKTRFSKLSKSVETVTAVCCAGGGNTSRRRRGDFPDTVQAPNVSSRNECIDDDSKGQKIVMQLEKAYKEIIASGPSLEGRRTVSWRRGIPSEGIASANDWLLKHDNAMPLTILRLNQAVYVIAQVLTANAERGVRTSRHVKPKGDRVADLRRRLAILGTARNRIMNELTRRNTNVSSSKRSRHSLQLVRRDLKCSTSTGSLRAESADLARRISHARAVLGRAKCHAARREANSKAGTKDAPRPKPSGDPPSPEEIETFWRDIIGKRPEILADRFVPSKPACEDLSQSYTVTPAVWGKVLGRVRPHKAAGPDGLPAVWYKKLSAAGEILRRISEEVINGDTELEQWFVEGRTVLLHKGGLTTNPANYRPIACLNTAFKIITATIAFFVYEEAAPALHPSQRAVRKGVRGTLDCLLLDEALCSDAVTRKKDLHVAWIDYKKAFDMVPHELIDRCLPLYGVSGRLTRTIMNLTALFQTRYTMSTGSGVVKSDPVHYLRGIFQGDSLSPLLFVLALNPLQECLDAQPMVKTKFGIKLNSLWFMDDLKVYARTAKELASTLEAIIQTSKAIGMELGLAKCNELHCVEGEVVTESHSDTFDVLSEANRYKYLGVRQFLRSDREATLADVREKFAQRAKQAYSTGLNTENARRLYNSCAVGALSYVASCGLITSTEGESLDAAGRRIMRRAKALQKRQEIDRLYLKPENGGVGLISIAEMSERAIVGSSEYVRLNKTHDPLLAALWHEWSERDNSNGKFRVSFNRKASHVYDKYSLSGESQAQLVLRKKQAEVRCLRMVDNKPVASLAPELPWLREGRVDPSDCALILSAQDGRLCNNRAFLAKVAGSDIPSECRLCGKHPETVSHMVAGCEVTRLTTVLSRHNDLVGIVYRAACRQHDMNPSYTKNSPATLTEREGGQIWYDHRFTFEGVFLEHSCPDLVVIDRKACAVTVFEVAVCLPALLEERTKEKSQRYTQLAELLAQGEQRRSENGGTKWTYSCHAIVLGAFGEVRNDTAKTMGNCFPKSSAKCLVLALSRFAALGTARVLKRHLAS